MRESPRSGVGSTVHIPRATFREATPTQRQIRFPTGAAPLFRLRPRKFPAGGVPTGVAASDRAPGRATPAHRSSEPATWPGITTITGDCRQNATCSESGAAASEKEAPKEEVDQRRHFQQAWNRIVGGEYSRLERPAKRAEVIAKGKPAAHDFQHGDGKVRVHSNPPTAGTSARGGRKNRLPRASRECANPTRAGSHRAP